MNRKGITAAVAGAIIAAGALTPAVATGVEGGGMPPATTSCEEEPGDGCEDSGEDQGDGCPEDPTPPDGGCSDDHEHGGYGPDCWGQHYPGKPGYRPFQPEAENPGTNDGTLLSPLSGLLGLITGMPA
ncbi:hypothetical protein [Allostreptomyces psammosilenae]|uniref:Uncharacterized protein n=1 Tax=Allostreptomyces psammosilenae TaxID=1892865 RepID=A0A852ZQB5_9ACTN|nr:hypothetical protein [Allostreptomyces psammosilenae]NYI04636.1 hypothetical protein [Allostreptomyces psammosilenae]